MYSFFPLSTQSFLYRAFTFFGPGFHHGSRKEEGRPSLGFFTKKKRGLVRGRSHLLPESRLISLPRGTEMFHFPRCFFCLSLCSWEIKTLSRCAKVLLFVLVYVPFLEDQGIPLVHPLSLRFHEYVFSGSSGGDRTHGPRSMNPMLVPLSYTAKVESPPSRSQSSGTANLQKKTGRKRIV